MGRPVLPVASVTSPAAVAIYSSGGAHRYRLLFGPPVPGYDAYSRPLVEASQLAMDELLRCLESGGPGPVPGRAPEQLAEWTQARRATATPGPGGNGARDLGTPARAGLAG